MSMTAASPNRFEPERLEVRLAPLDALPRGCWLPAIVNNEGDPFDRIGHMADWYRQWIEGGSPSREAGTAGPDGGSQHRKGLPEDIVKAFLSSVERARLQETCRHQPAVAEQLLRSLLWHIDQVARRCDAVPRSEAVAQAVAAFESEWVERGEVLREVMRLFESLDGVLDPARWSELQGLLRSESWQQVLAALELVATMPRLAALIRSLGRARAADDDVPQPVPDPSRQAGPDEWICVLAEVDLPGTPIEVEGIRRSGDIARMLLGEAAWASRRLAPERARRLRRLFAARLAEQALLTFEHRSRWVEERRERRPAPLADPVRRPMPRLDAGPLVACIDTSASMAGGPERVAKAILVEVMRVAAREGRRCHVYAFSGAGQVQEFELAGDLDGLQRLAGFVSSSFHGGTDVVEPLERAISRIADARWRQADLLVVSDGEFGPTRATVEAVATARRELGLRVQGVLVGDRETSGMRAIVDDVFWVRDWRRYGGRHGQHDSPVHDSRLTSLYFPNLSGSPGSDATDAYRKAAGDTLRALLGPVLLAMSVATGWVAPDAMAAGHEAAAAGTEAEATLQRVAERREALAREWAQRERACYRKFLVNPCLETLRLERLAAERQLEALEVAARQALREAAAIERNRREAARIAVDRRAD